MFSFFYISLSLSLSAMGERSNNLLPSSPLLFFISDHKRLPRRTSFVQVSLSLSLSFDGIKVWEKNVGAKKFFFFLTGEIARLLFPCEKERERGQRIKLNFLLPFSCSRPSWNTFEAWWPRRIIVSRTTNPFFLLRKHWWYFLHIWFLYYFLSTYQYTYRTDFFYF